MGAKGKNFYHDLASRYGFEEAADTIQDHYLGGDKDAAAAAVPDELVDEVCLVGPISAIKDRLAAWKESRVDILTLSTQQSDVVEALADYA
jgi:hypothetical protein